MARLLSVVSVAGRTSYWDALAGTRSDVGAGDSDAAPGASTDAGTF